MSLHAIQYIAATSSVEYLPITSSANHTAAILMANRLMWAEKKRGNTASKLHQEQMIHSRHFVYFIFPRGFI